MRRVEVSKRFGSAEEVRGSLTAHRGRIGGRLGAQRPPSPETGFSYEVMFDHFDGELAKVESQLVEAEDQHVKQLAKISRLRRQRDQGVADMYEKQTAARGVLANLYGKDLDFELAAVSGRTPLYSKTLAEQVDQTVKFLRNPEDDEPSRRVAGVAVDLTTMADDLDGGQKQLIQVRTDLVRAKKVADGTRQTTQQAIKEFDLVFLWIARSLEGLFRLAGEQELADRVRTSARRVTRRQADQEAEPTESSSDDDSEEETESAPSKVTEEASQPADS